MSSPIPPASEPTPYAASTGPVAKTNTLAIVALILGIVVPIAGIIVGHIALSQIKKTGEQGRGLALAGTIIGYVLTVGALLFWILWGVIFAASMSMGGYSY